MGFTQRTKKPRPALGREALFDYAAKTLAAKAKSERELRRRLTGRAERSDDGTADVEHVMARLREYGYLNDERFAAEFTRLRQENEKFGKRRVQQGLMQRGVPSAIANEALTTAYEDVDEAALAREYIERKRMKKPEGDKETARAVRRLVGAGFGAGVVWKVLRAWGAEVDEAAVSDAVEGMEE